MTSNAGGNGRTNRLLAAEPAEHRHSCKACGASFRCFFACDDEDGAAQYCDPCLERGGTKTIAGPT